MDNEQNNQPKSNMIAPKSGFGLEHSPDAYVISVHIRNMMATYGEEYVRSVLVELFLSPQQKTILDQFIKAK